MSRPVDAEEDIDWEQGDAPRSAYSEELIDDSPESDVEDEGPITAPSYASIQRIGQAFARASHAGGAAEPSSAMEDVPTAATAGKDVAVEDAEDAEDEDEEEDEEEDDDDDELGEPGAADRAFQDELLRQQQQSTGSGGDNEDLLSKILSGKTSSAAAAAAGARRGDSGKERGDSDEEGAGARASIGEDTIDYQIYSDRWIDAETATSAEAMTAMAALRLAALQYVSTYTAEYLWQKDAFNLQICSPALHIAPVRSLARQQLSAHSSTFPHLHGSVYFGENGEEEWFTIFLLLQLSSHYPDLSILARDSDGEPLAIEVAEHLPEEISGAEQARNRVWIRRGMLHLVPVPKNPAELSILPARPSLEQSIRILCSSSIATQASSATQQVLWKKLQRFVDASMKIPFQLDGNGLSSSHHARVFLPLSLALLLSVYPQLVGEWTHAFFYRDQIDMKRGNKMDRVLGAAGTGAKKAQTTIGSAAVAEEDGKMSDVPAVGTTSSATVPFVFVRLRFTHCLYAQLLHQRFGSPRPYARCVTSALSSLPTLNPSSPAVERAVDLGTKLSVGAEMWRGNRESEVTKRSKRAEAVVAEEMKKRSTSPAAIPTKVTPGLLADIAHRASQQQEFTSANDVELFLEAQAPTLVFEWRSFLSSVESRRVSSFLPSAPVYARACLMHFLYTHWAPHRCTDHEVVDEAGVHPTKQAWFDPAAMSTQEVPSRTQHRVDSVVNLPYDAKLLETMDALCEVTMDADTTTSFTLSPSIPSTLPSSLLFNTLSSLPPDESDAWLHLGQEDLDRMMREHAASSSSADMHPGPAALRGEDIVSAMKGFVKKVSSVEGVEMDAKSRKGSKYVRVEEEEKKGSDTPAQPTVSSAKPAPKSILKSSTAASASAPSAISTPAKSSVNIDTNELMRLLNAAKSFVPPTAGGDAISFNQSLFGSGSTAASELPQSDSEEEESDGEELLPEDMEDDAPHNNRSKPSHKPPRGATIVELCPDEADDSDPSAPNATNTRPPKQDAYAALFGGSTVDQDHAEPMETDEKEQQTTGEDPKKRAASSSPPIASSTSASASLRSSKKPKLTDYMDAMDAELHRSGFQSSFVRGDGMEVDEPSAGAPASDSTAAAAPAPVNVDVNLLANLLQSHAAEVEASEQGGSQAHAGPVTSIMTSMGLRMPTTGEAEQK
jgi:hypothetical protein